MKKLIFTLLVSVLCVSGILAQDGTKTYNYTTFGNITEIEAGFVYEIYVTKGRTSKIEVTYPERYENKLIINHNGYGKLILRNDQIKYSKNGERVIVKLQMEEIREIDLSGAAKLYIDGEFTTNELDIELSGASKIGRFMVNSNELSIESSGASSLELVGNYREIDLESSGACNIKILSKETVNELDSEISGACKLTLDFNTYTYKGEYSGACLINSKGIHNNMSIESSGSCTFNLEGAVKNLLNIHLSGACKMNATNLNATNANVVLTGVSKAEVTVKKNLNVNIGKVSKLVYHGNPTNFVDTSSTSNIVKAD
jgi:hypothetical protein